MTTRYGTRFSVGDRELGDILQAREREIERLRIALDAAQRAGMLALDELRHAVGMIGVVGQVDGFDVVRRASVLEIIDRRRTRP